MFCAQCGTELPSGVLKCPACGFMTSAGPTPAGSGSATDTVDRFVADTKRAARDLADAAERLSKRLISEVEAGAKEPSKSAKKAARRISDEIDSVGQEIEKFLKEL